MIIMFSNPGIGYDRGITIFSPDGRLFQVEYAIEAVRRGTTAIALKCPDGVIFGVERRTLPLQEKLGSEKLFKIDDHVGVAIAGLTADARSLVDQARVQAQVNILSYNERISVLETVRTLCDNLQLYTQNAGVRPFGVSLLVGGIDPEDGKPQLYMTDPSGSFWGYRACAIGAGSSAAREYLMNNYDAAKPLADQKKLIIDVLKEVSEDELTAEKFEIAMISQENKAWKLLSLEENQALLE